MKEISNYFEKKKKRFIKHQDNSSQLKDTIREFLISKYGETINGISLVINYNPNDTILSITTPSKVIANELSFCLNDLVDRIRKENIKLSKVLIK